LFGIHRDGDRLFPATIENGRHVAGAPHTPRGIFSAIFARQRFHNHLIHNFASCMLSGACRAGLAIASLAIAYLNSSLIEVSS
jgi:hypothetical protein